MNKACIIWVAVVVSLFRTALASPDSVSGHRISQEQIARIETNIQRAIVFHLYWQQGKSVAQIHSLFSKSPTMSYKLCHGNADDLFVFLDDYQWKLDLTPIGKVYYGFDVEDFRALARGNEVESRRSYLEVKNREPQITNGLLTLRPEALSVLAFEKSGRLHGVVTNMLITYLAGPEESKMLRERIVADKVHGPPILHVGGFSRQSPWIYYYFDGIPYVGTMLIDPANGELIHDDFVYVEEGNEAAERQNMVRAIKENGEKLTLNLPGKHK